MCESSAESYIFYLWCSGRNASQHSSPSPFTIPLLPASLVPPCPQPTLLDSPLPFTLLRPLSAHAVRGGRQEKNMFARRVQVRSGYVIFLSQSSDRYELVIRFWPTESLHWPTVQIKGKLRSRRAKYNGSSLLCQQTAFPFLASLFSQVLFTLQPE